MADPIVFPNHYDWWGKYMKYLKKEGKGQVQHKPRLHQKFLEEAMTLAYYCLRVSYLKTNICTNVMKTFTGPAKQRQA